MKTSAVPAQGFFRRYALGIAFTGFVAGIMTGTFLATVEKPVFESTTVCRPIRPDKGESGASHREWLNTEAVALGAHANLQRVTKNLNLSHEWKCSEDECVRILQSRLEIAVPPETELVRVTARGNSSQECAALVNGVILAREELTKPEARPEAVERLRAIAARTNAIRDSRDQKRKELVGAVKALGAGPGILTDDELNALNLPELLAQSREEWRAEANRLHAAVSELNTAGASLERQAPYAEVLEPGMPSVNPVPREWFPRAAWWAVVGATAGLLLAALLAVLSRRMPRREGPDHLSPQPLMAGEY
jgi:hypothetical protein